MDPTERILEQLGEVRFYVNERLGQPLVVTDDDIAGTFTFVRALEDHGRGADITAREIGLTWLDYVIEERTTFWWGGKGVSTEHTAFLNLRNGIEAPASGSAKKNGRVVAEQIGAQIFIDGWAMIAAGSPRLAVKLAGEAARVSHDGVAVHAAQLIAAMEAEAFVQPDMWKLLELGLTFLPLASPIVQVAEDVANWVRRDLDWREVRMTIDHKYGYHKYPGNCHVVPNHAIVLLSLFACKDDFQTALTIANTSGWDTDCNAGNVGCLMGIKNGLAGLTVGADFRAPVADQMYVPSAEPGEAVTDAVREAVKLVNIRRSLHHKAPFAPKGGARFHFEFPGSVQGFHLENDVGVSLRNIEGHSLLGQRSLAIALHTLRPSQPVRISTPTFAPEEIFARPGYGLVACPTLYQGQTIGYGFTAGVPAGKQVQVMPFIKYVDGFGSSHIRHGPSHALTRSERVDAAWQLATDIAGPIQVFGFEVEAEDVVAGDLFLDYVGWDGDPTLMWQGAGLGGSAWRRAWSTTQGSVAPTGNGTLTFDPCDGTGLAILGTREWRNYRVTAVLQGEREVEVGVAARVRGKLRYLALRVLRETASIVHEHYGSTILFSRQVSAAPPGGRRLEVYIHDHYLSAQVDGLTVVKGLRTNAAGSGAAAIYVRGGPIKVRDFSVQPLT